MGILKGAKAILGDKSTVRTSSLSALSEAWQSEQRTSSPGPSNHGPTIGFCIQSVVGVVSPLLSEDG